MNYFKLLNLITLTLVIYSCKPEKDEQASDNKFLVEEPILIKVLSEAYLSEAASSLNIKGVSFEKFDSTYSFNVLKENHIDRAKFDSTITFYTNHPKQFKTLFDKVLLRLDSIQKKGKIK